MLVELVDVAGAAADARGGVMAGELILIVEDNERNLKLLRDVLGAHGYRVVEARSAEEALVLARVERPQLVLMDIQLPGMDGLAALRELRARPRRGRCRSSR